MRLTNLPSAEPRIKVVQGRTYEIHTYDIDNCYPQRMLSLINASGTAKSAVKLLAKYIVGKGFADLSFFKAKINPKNLTADKLLRRLAADKGQFRGFAIHVNWNASYKVESAFYVPFENCRLGADNHEGQIAIHSDWDAWKSNRRVKKDEIEFIDRFDPNPVMIEEQVLAAGGWDKYKGQIYWYSDDFESYPLASIDPVIEPVKAEIESDRTTTSNLRNNFTAKVIFGNVGEFEDEEEREVFTKGVKAFVGPDGEQAMIAEVKTKDELPVIIPIVTNLNDKLFEYTDKKVSSRIIQYFNQPSILHSIMDVKSFNVQQMSDSMAYYNGITQDERILMEEVFAEIFVNFKDNINPTGNYQVTQLQYDIPIPETKTETITEDDSNKPTDINS